MLYTHVVYTLSDEKHLDRIRFFSTYLVLDQFGSLGKV